MREKKLRSWRRIAAETRGSQIAEAALVLPIVFMLLFGIIWFGRAYNIYTTITYAAREGAQVAAQPSCATCGNTTNNATAVYNRVADVLRASHINPGQIGSYSPNPAPTGGTCGTMATATQGNVKVYTNVQLNPGSVGPQACGVVVSFEYPYQFNFPFTSLNKQLVLLKAAVQMQAEN